MSDAHPGTKDQRPTLGCRIPSSVLQPCQGMGKARARKNITKLSSYFECSSFLIQHSLDCCKLKPFFRVLTKWVLMLSACFLMFERGEGEKIGATNSGISLTSLQKNNLVTGIIFI